MRIGVHGASGRMGRLLLEAINADPGLKIGAALISPDAPDVGTSITLSDGSQVTLSGDRQAAAEQCDGFLDFSSPEGTSAIAFVCGEARLPLLVGTTGLEAAQLSALEQVATSVPVMIAANTSLGAHVLFEISKMAHSILGPEYDAEIVELHHRGKRDAPSGTAHSLALALREISPELDIVSGRSGVKTRTPSEIGIASARGGSVTGIHTLYLLGDGEQIEITHRVSDRRVFAFGALRMLRALAGAAPGLYHPADLLSPVGND